MLRWVVFAVVGSALGCGSEKKDEPMTEVVEGFGAELTALDTATTEHETSVHSFASLTGIQNEEADFKTLALGKCGAVSEHITEMGHCKMNGTAPDTAGTTVDLEALKAEFNLHASNMAEATDEMDAHEEEERFQDAFDTLLEAMHNHHATFSTSAAEYMCNHPTEHEGDHD